MATLRDIAKEAGVSVMTVSNVINGNHSKVSVETTKRIQEIVQRLNYIPNSTARSLTKRNSNIIAVILRGEAEHNALQNPHNAALVGTLINQIRKHGYYSMVSIMKSESEISQSLQTWNVEGAVFLGMFDDEIEKMCAVTSIPIVFIDSYSDVRRLSNVGIDDYKGGQLAARCFIQNHHENVAFIGPTVKHTGVVQNRFAGFCDELRIHGLSIKPEHHFVVHSDVDLNEINTIGAQLASFKDEITAAFVSSDQIASFLINSLRSHGVRIPEDISLIGFDDLPICQQLSPPLTTIAQNLTQKAVLAIDILFRRMKEPNAPAESLILDVELKERSSVINRQIHG